MRTNFARGFSASRDEGSRPLAHGRRVAYPWLGFSGKSGGRFSKNDLMPSCASALAGDWPKHCSPCTRRAVLAPHMLHISRLLTVAATRRRAGSEFFASAARRQQVLRRMDSSAPVTLQRSSARTIRRHQHIPAPAASDQGGRNQQNPLHRHARLLKTKPDPGGLSTSGGCPSAGQSVMPRPRGAVLSPRRLASGS